MQPTIDFLKKQAELHGISENMVVWLAYMQLHMFGTELYDDCEKNEKYASFYRVLKEALYERQD